jgi:hypothetical protein
MPKMFVSMATRAAISKVGHGSSLFFYFETAMMLGAGRNK